MLVGATEPHHKMPAHTWPSQPSRTHLARAKNTALPSATSTLRAVDDDRETACDSFVFAGFDWGVSDKCFGCFG